MGSIRYAIEMGTYVVIFIGCIGSLIFAIQYYHNINKKKREEKEKREKYDLARKKEENLNAGN